MKRRARYRSTACGSRISGDAAWREAGHSMRSPFLAFEEKAKAKPDAAFLKAPESAALPYAPQGFHISYGEAFDTIQALRTRFGNVGFGAGCRVALLLENRPEFFVHWLALNALGVSIVPINPDLRPAELEYQLGLAEVELLVTHSKTAAVLSDFSNPAVRVIIPGEDIQPPTVAARRQHGEPGDECALLFTSGSTGKPKGCMLSNAYFMTLADWYVTQGGIAWIDEDCEVALTPLPMFHMNALGCTALGMIVKGGAIVPLDRFHPKRWWQSVKDSGATIVHFLGVIPAILLQLPKSPAEIEHRVKFSLGPGVGARHKIEFEERYGFPIVEAWAMTETGGRATTTTARDEYTPGQRCIGRPRAGMEYRIVDDAGVPVTQGVPGELLVRAAGPDPRDGFFSGYLKEEQATEEAWAGGWFHTGDLVFEDEHGLLYFFDRKKSIVRRSGENIAVLEVETALAGSDALKAVAVTPVPDEIRGEEVFAFFVKADGAGTDPRAMAEQIVRDGAAQLSYHKLPGYAAFVDELPLGSTQKLQRGEIKAMAANLVQQGQAMDLREFKAAMRKTTRHS
ncbi:AMP-binding protein [Mesorhizobium sp. LHD-90]|uniref:AMP-binding protein n=1 Tax=Mesorhizobium sp. LHD-90 TaxID=3071414 RepID=UPI0027DFF5D6|nr:AMP-binding protein [Mesorhizobium sp. LHD-90]MDQ6438066.1 AMP-binding protein [Mesorhizobium sp. LHD-90]